MSLRPMETSTLIPQGACARASPAVHDSELLRRYVHEGDETAFQNLLWRHGPMVLRLCRRLLRDPYASDDAFQATFVTLAFKADRIRSAESLAGWLYRVAYRVAVRARASHSKRAEREQSLSRDVIHSFADEPVDDLANREATSILSQEIACLPEKFRIVIVLCYLQGKSNEEAAQTLGCPKGTIDSRLSRARKRLRKRLKAQGVTVGLGALLAAMLSAGRAGAVSPALAQATQQVVARSMSDGGSAVQGLLWEGGSARAATTEMSSPSGLKWALPFMAALLLGLLGWMWQASAKESAHHSVEAGGNATEGCASCERPDH